MMPTSYQLQPAAVEDYEELFSRGIIEVHEFVSFLTGGKSEHFTLNTPYRAFVQNLPAYMLLRKAIKCGHISYSAKPGELEGHYHLPLLALLEWAEEEWEGKGHPIPENMQKALNNMRTAHLLRDASLDEWKDLDVIGINELINLSLDTSHETIHALFNDKTGLEFKRRKKIVLSAIDAGPQVLKTYQHNSYKYGSDHKVSLPLAIRLFKRKGINFVKPFSTFEIASPPTQRQEILMALWEDIEKRTVEQGMTIDKTMMLGVKEEFYELFIKAAPLLNKKFPATGMESFKKDLSAVGIKFRQGSRSSKFNPWKKLYPDITFDRQEK